MKLPFTAKVIHEDETTAIANRFAGIILQGDVIVLNGNLGAGKTFFIKKVLKNFGIENANSPTFAIVNEYEGRLKFYHFDFYRINRSAELFDIGINDYLTDSDAVTFIEWGNLMPEVLPHKRIEVNIEMNDPGTSERIFNFVKYD